MDGSSFDSLGRRKRLSPVSTGKRVTLQDRDLQWLQMLHEHGPLPSSFLLARTADMRRSEKRARERLTDLFNEENTAHGGPYLALPPQQFRTIDSRYNPLVYDLAPAGVRALKAAGLWRPAQAARTGPWLHGHMVACLTASIELSCRARDDVSYIAPHRILERAGAELRCPVPFEDPASGRRIVKDLIPDAVFCLEYRMDNGSGFRFFVLEADRATEPATSGNWNRKSFLRNLLQYRAYIRGGLYRHHLKLTAPLLVLQVTTDAMRLGKMLDLTASQTPDTAAFHLFRQVDRFGPVYRPPDPMPELLDGDWGRAGMDSLRIDLAKRPIVR